MLRRSGFRSVVSARDFLPIAWEKWRERENDRGCMIEDINERARERELEFNELAPSSSCIIHPFSFEG